MAVYNIICRHVMEINREQGSLNFSPLEFMYNIHNAYPISYVYLGV